MTRDRDILDRIIGTAENLGPRLTATRTILIPDTGRKTCATCRTNAATWKRRQTNKTT